LARIAAPAIFAALLCIWLASGQGIPYLVVLVAICAAAAEVLMRRTRFGARLYAIGGNPEAARLSGIDLKRMIFWNFVIAGFGYGVTGMALTARVSGAIGGTAGLFLELDAIAAAIIGGTSLAGGRGRILGALLGALLMGSLNNGMSLMNVPIFYQNTARGAVLLLAVAIDHLSRARIS
jgi:D-xylose transport system permease protein